MLWRYADSPILMDYTGHMKYTDAGDIALWAQQGVMWAHQQGILTGRNDQCLAPDDTAERSEVANMLMRFVELQD